MPVIPPTQGRTNKRFTAQAQSNIWLKYFLYMYEYGTLKPVKSYFKKGCGGRGRIMEGK
jgi:hypothetical protein